MEQQDAKLLKQKQRKKKMKYGSVAVAITLIVTAIVILLNVVVGLLVERYPNAKLDLTTSNLYEVSDETIDYIKNLEDPVEIIRVIPVRWKSPTSIPQKIQTFSPSIRASTAEPLVRIM